MANKHRHRDDDGPKPPLAQRMAVSAGVALLTAVVVTVCGLGLGLLLNSIPAVMGGMLGGAVAMQLLFMRRGWMVIPVAVLVSLSLLFVVLITPSTRDARRAEAEQMLGAAKNHVRVAYAKTGRPADIRSLTEPIGQGGCGMPPSEMRGIYFTVTDKVTINGSTATLVAESLPGVRMDGPCTMAFELKGGEASINWAGPSVWDSLHNRFMREEIVHPPANNFNERPGNR